MTLAEGACVGRRELLLRLAEELSDLSASTSSIQVALGKVLGGAPGNGEPPEGFWHVQQIDRLQQILDDLSAVLLRVAEADAPRLEVAPLVAVVRLGALRERLRGAERGAETARQAGIVTIF